MASNMEYLIFINKLSQHLPKIVLAKLSSKSDLFTYKLT